MIVGIDHAASAQADAAHAPLLQVVDLSKSFGTLRANSNISFSLAHGEILGLAGENGAGKSTLVKMLAGAMVPDSGKILIDGRLASLNSPADAQRQGIGLVYQHFKLISSMSVEENLILGRPDLRRGRLRFDEWRPIFQEVADELGTKIRFSQKVRELSVGGRQQIELIKALSSNPRILILDEPTAVLPPSERENLLQIVRRLKARGTATILISHKLDDHYACCDRAIVLRGGKAVGECRLEADSRPKFINMVVGHELSPPSKRSGHEGPPVVSARNLSIGRDDGSTAVQNVSFEIRSGEVLGLCGVEGNGQSELVEALAGLRAPQAGQISYALNGKVRSGLGPAALTAAGVAHVPEDRLRHGVVASFDLMGNWLLRKLTDRRFAHFGLLKRNAIRNATVAAMQDYDVRAPSPKARMSDLSGGNQQKFVLAREMKGAVSVILAGHPTRGLDLQTVAAIRDRLLLARDQRAAILFLSGDLAEIWDVADRVMVMSHGKLHGPVAIEDTSLAEVGRWMTAP